MPTPKWKVFKSDRGTYVCPACGRDLGSGPGIANHMKREHRAMFDRIMIGDDVKPWQSHGRETGVFAKGQPPAVLSPAVQQHEQAQARLTTALRGMPPEEAPTATDATLAILNLTEVRHLSVDDLRAVFDVVCKIREVDSGKPRRQPVAEELSALEETGFDTGNLRKHLAGAAH